MFRDSKLHCPEEKCSGTLSYAVQKTVRSVMKKILWDSLDAPKSEEKGSSKYQQQSLRTADGKQWRLASHLPAAASVLINTNHS
ncbi:hypothetical protein RRG08_032534 [Elysia crispata]|uniref:Uncharacterized protein n=1 Tax=Elysia crispata TaxID=231223 RepID=A0AAE0ZYU7_9GAST|nr:hypothetical protein RRG08_032534 [Elysia crispata]